MSTTKANLVLEHRGFSDPLLSLRGIAAMMVLIFHAMLFFKVSGQDPVYFRFPTGDTLDLLINHTLVFLTNGGAAVIFFFVHSGFVLSLSLDKTYTHLNGSKGILLASFYIKRLFRLYPVIIVSAFLGLGVMLLTTGISPGPLGTGWSHGFFVQAKGTLSDTFRSAYMVGEEYNKFAWSLRVEFLISLLMPLLFLAMRTPTTAVLFVFIFAGLTLFLRLSQTALAQLTEGFVHSDITLYVLCFVAGFLIGRGVPLYHTITQQTLLRRISPGTFSDIGILVGFLALLLARPLFNTTHPDAAILMETVASMPIIFLIYYGAKGRAYAFCNHIIVRFLGSISYSLYMLSSASIFIAGLIIANLYSADFISRYGLIANLSVTCLAILFAVALATPCYRYIEVPLMNYGKRLGDKVAHKLMSARIALA